jgi:hypothetical protein
MGVVGAETVTEATGAIATVIEEVPLCPSLVAVTVVVPAAAAVTRPFASTVAAAAMLETQVIVRPVTTVPFASLVTAVNCCVGVIPRTRFAVPGVTVTVATGASDTVSEEVPLCPSLVAVIVVLPAATAVTKPLASTVAAAVLLETHVTTLPVSTLSFASFVTAVNCWVGVIPRTRLAVAGLTVTVATGTGLTVIVGVGLELTDSLVAVIVAVPRPTAVTVAGDPLALTVNTALLLETQVIVRPVRRLPFASLVVAVSC